MSSSIQGRALEVTVTGCTNLNDTRLFTKQDPYVVLNYAGTEFRTRTCVGGDRNPVFNDRFVFELVEGRRDMSVEVRNKRMIHRDSFIGGGRVLLQTVLSEGVDESSWTIQGRNGRSAGVVKLIMRYHMPPQIQQGAPRTGNYGEPPPPPGAYAGPSNIPPATPGHRFHPGRPDIGNQHHYSAMPAPAPAAPLYPPVDMYPPPKPYHPLYPPPYSGAHM